MHAGGSNFNSAAPDLAGWTLCTPRSRLPARSARDVLICKYDLLAIRDGKALIYDWKTFARRPKAEYLAARMQTRVYRSLLIQAGHGTEPRASRSRHPTSP